MDGIRVHSRFGSYPAHQVAGQHAGTFFIIQDGCFNEGLNFVPKNLFINDGNPLTLKLDRVIQ